MNRLSSRFLGAVILLLVLCGCGTSSANVASGFPPRPVELTIDRIDPCAMFDAAQKRSLTLRGENPSRPTVNGQPSAGCTWLSSSDLDYGAQTFPIAAEQARTAPGAELIEVNGFGAIRNVDRTANGLGAPNCQVTVDAASGAAIRVQVGGAIRVNRSDDEMCRLATEAASMVMTTVVKNSG